MTRTAWFNCRAGVAGDMTLGALVDAGADPDAVADAIAALGVTGYALSFERVQRCGVAATWANVVVDDHDAHAHPHRPAAEIQRLLADAELPERVRRRASAVFERLAAVEARIHGIDPADVELHEVGALDAIIDVVGACAALESLGVEDVACGPVAVGVGDVHSAHGTLPNPAPATVALLTGAGMPTVGLATGMEVTTPTGAALMTTLATTHGAMPAMTLSAVGYGAGTADVAERANVVQVVIGERADDGATSDGAPVTLLEANVDDVSGEVLAHTISALLDAGAHDAWVTPIVMKKGRPAHTISALCDPARSAAIREVLVTESGTLGVRASSLVRWPQRREEHTVDVDGHQIRVKVAGHRVKVEFDDARRAADALGLPVRDILHRAESLAKHLPIA